MNKLLSRLLALAGLRSQTQSEETLPPERVEETLLEPAKETPPVESREVRKEAAAGTAEERPPDAGSEKKTGALAEPVYPVMAPKPREEDFRAEDGWGLDESYYDAMQAWQTELQALREQPLGKVRMLFPCFAALSRALLTGEPGENRVCSPMNISLALAMLAECTAGKSRKQLLDLLGAKNTETLRQTARALWQTSYQDDGATRSLLANSLWMAQGLGYVPETLEKLAAVYYAASFRGEMGSPEYDEQLQSWINEQTGGLLQSQSAGLHMDPGTVLALVSTLRFECPWREAFQEADTRKGLFRGPEGEQELDFLHRSGTESFFRGERFGALGLDMQNGGAMWLLLPDEASSPEALLQDPEALAFLLTPEKGAWPRQKRARVNLALPKFDVSADLDLIGKLKDLGITEIFDAQRSDFTPLTRDTEGLEVSQARHAARVLVDENGCKAAAFTVIMVTKSAIMPPEEELDFVLDRPFLFAVTNARGLPLFVGLVNKPEE